MSIDALLTPYKGLAPYLSRPAIDVYTSFGGLTSPESPWGAPVQEPAPPQDGDTPFVKGWNEGFLRGSEVILEQANEISADNYKHGMNHGYVKAFEYLIGGPKVAIVDASGESIKWYAGETITDIIGTKQNPTRIRGDNPKYAAFDPEVKWHVDPRKTKPLGTLAQDPKEKQSQWAYSEYDGILYLDMDILRTKAQSNTMKGRVVTALDEPKEYLAKDKGVPLAFGETPVLDVGQKEQWRKYSSYLKPEVASVDTIISKLTRNVGIYEQAFTPTQEDILRMSRTSLIEYNANL